MSDEKREWKTEGEIEGMVRGILDERDGAWKKEIRERFDAFGMSLEKIADGAMASILSANILHGNPDMGLEGFVPEVRRRLDAIEGGQVEDRGIVQTHHDSNSDRFDGVEERLTALEESSHRFRRWVKRMCDSIISDQKRLAALMAALGIAAHFLLNHMPSWFDIKRFLITLGTHLPS